MVITVYIPYKIVTKSKIIGTVESFSPNHVVDVSCLISTIKVTEGIDCYRNSFTSS